MDDESTISGDTYVESSQLLTPILEYTESQITPQTQTILTEMEKMLEKKFESNRLSLIPEIKSIIKTEVLNAILNMESKLMNNINNLKKDQETLKKDLHHINTLINTIETENTKLQKTISSIQDQIIQLQHQHGSQTARTPSKSQRIEDKKIVIYGLEERQWENEFDLHDRIVYIFQDLLNVNISGYIEEISRLGKTGNRRPLVIEMLSKKMTKFILLNKRYFKNTGLVVTEFLDKTTLREQNLLRRDMMEARKKGHHAIIKNGSLFIDGKDSKRNCATQAPQNMSNTSFVKSQNSDKNPTPESYHCEASKNSTPISNQKKSQPLRRNITFRPFRK